MLAEEGEAPRALLDRPEVDPHLGLVWDAFQEVSTDRHIDGMGAVGEIPFSAIDRYAHRFGFDSPDEFDRFRQLLRAMDREYLSVVNKQREVREKDRKRK